MITKPMLAEVCEDYSKITFPVMATPKLDGIRCLVVKGQAVSRQFKPIPNDYIRTKIEQIFPNGVDGEIMVTGGFQNVTSTVMTKKDSQKPVPFQYWVFDYVPDGDITVPYRTRMKNLARMQVSQPEFYYPLIPKIVNSVEELMEVADDFETQGFEGTMIRTPDGPYKCGRSTMKEGYLLKIKKFLDSEAIILGFEERMHNENELTQDAFGYAKRSSHQGNKTPAGTLGSLLVEDPSTGMEFSIGTGFDDALRAEIWANRDKYKGQIVKYKYQPYGVKDLPRFPVFLGFRHPDDM